MLQACLNGARSRDFHTAVPFTAVELARDAALCCAAGAEEFHIHPRDASGLETFSGTDIAEALAAVRAAAPGKPVGLSTREGIVADPVVRAAAFAAWTVLPDYVSVNLSEADAPEVISQMLSRGVGIEAGLATVADARRFVDLPVARRALRVLIEIEEQASAEALTAAHAIIAILDKATLTMPRQLHGFDASQWPLHEEAVRLGYQRRIGLEDGKIMPDGTITRNNAQMVSTAAKAVSR